MIKFPKQPQSENNHYLTSLIDILFILIVFLILTMNIPLETIGLDLPKIDKEKNSTSSINNHILILSINDKTYFLNKTPIANLTELKAIIKQEVSNQSNKKIFIEAEKDLSISRMFNILKFLQEEKIDTANIIIKKNK